MGSGCLQYVYQARVEQRLTRYQTPSIARYAFMSIAEKIRQYSPRPATLQKTGLCTALGLALLVPGLPGLQAKLEEPAVYQPVAPTIDQARANILIARQLQRSEERRVGNGVVL